MVWPPTIYFARGLAVCALVDSTPRGVNKELRYVVWKMCSDICCTVTIEVRFLASSAEGDKSV